MTLASYSQGRKSHSASTILRLLGRGLLQRTNEPEQIVLEDIVTWILQRVVVNPCNKLFYRNYKLGLQQMETADGLCTR